MQYKRKVRELEPKLIQSEAADHRLLRKGAVAVGDMVGDAIFNPSTPRLDNLKKHERTIYKSDMAWENAPFDHDMARIRAAGSM